MRKLPVRWELCFHTIDHKRNRVWRYSTAIWTGSCNILGVHTFVLDISKFGGLALRIASTSAIMFAVSRYCHFPVSQLKEIFRQIKLNSKDGFIAKKNAHFEVLLSCS